MTGPPSSDLGPGVAVLLAAGLLTAHLAGEVSRGRQLVYVFALPYVGLVIVGLEVAAHEAYADKRRMQISGWAI